MTRLGPRRARRALQSSALGACFLVAAQAHAEPPAAPGGAPATEEASAQAHLRRGVELRKERRHEEALAEFRQANDARPSAVARAQIALAQQALGRWLEAEADLTAALATPGDAWIAKNRASLDRAAEEVAAHLSWLVVETGVAGAEASLDGTPLTIGAGAKNRVPAGVAVLSVRAHGYVPDIRRVDLPSGKVVTVASELSPMVAATSAEPARDAAARPAATETAEGVKPAAVAASPARSPNYVGPIVLASGAVVALGVGAVFGVHALNLRADRDACADNACIRDKHASAVHSANASTVLLASAGGLAASSALWFFLARRAGTTAPATSARISPYVASTRSAGISFAGEF